MARGRKPKEINSEIVIPSKVENSLIKEAKKTNGETKNYERIGPDIDYDLKDTKDSPEQNINLILSEINEPVDETEDLSYLNVIQEVNLATVIGSVDEIDVKVLVDTGATVNAINKSFLLKIANKTKVFKYQKEKFKLAGGRIISTCYAVYLKLEFNGLYFTSLYWIIDDDEPCYDIILGRNSQKEHRLFIDPDDDGLYMKTSTTPVCVAAAHKAAGTSL